MDITLRWFYVTLVYFGTHHDVQMYDISNVSSDGKTNNNETYINFWSEVNLGLCDPGYVSRRNGTVCCIPVVCGPEHEIIPCFVNKKPDKCQKCENGSRQLEDISSLDMSRSSCFKELSTHKDCPIDDMKPARENFSARTLPLPCECKNEKCFFPNKIVGICKRVKPCSPGYYMNRTNGDCVACPWYSYKDTEGCQPCTINIEWLRFGRPYNSSEHSPQKTTAATTSSTVVVTPKTKSLTNLSIDEGKTGDSKSRPNDNSLVLLILIPICVTVVVIFVIAIAYFLWRGRNFQGRSSIETSDPLLAPTPTSLPTTPVNGFHNTLVPNGNTTSRYQVLNGTTPQGYNGTSDSIVHHIRPDTSHSVENELDNIHGNINIDEGGNHGNQTNTDSNEEKQNIEHPLPSTSANNSEQNAPENHSASRPYNFYSIHNNVFNNSHVHIGSRGHQTDFSGSFMEEPSLDSRPEGIGEQQSERSTLVQPGRGDCNIQYNSAHGAHANIEHDAGNCQPEYTRNPDNHTHVQEGQVGARRLEEETIAMDTLNKPPCAFVEVSDAQTNFIDVTMTTSVPVRDVNTALPRLPAQQVKKVAKVAPMCQENSTRQQSDHHVSGYLSRGNDESEDSSVTVDRTLSSNGYAFANMSSILDGNDIANTGDLSTLTEHSDVADAGTITSGRRVENINDDNIVHRAPVYAVTPLPLGPSPHGKSKLDSSDNAGIINAENTLPKVAMNDETDPKTYNTSCHGDPTVLASHDSETDLKKMKDGSSNVEEKSDSTADIKHELYLDDLDKTSELQVSKKVNSLEVVDEGLKIKDTADDTKGDENCNQDTNPNIEDGDQVENDCKENDCKENEDIHKVVANNVERTCVESSGDLSGDTSVEIEGLESGGDLYADTSVEIEGQESLENGQSCSDTLGNEPSDNDESFELDNYMPSGKSDDSFEIGGSVDIDAIHEENQHIQDVTCRGETYAMNSMSSGFRGLNPS
ncbi:hypothetical protein ACF0H5_020095 [Mactra antiquata]